MKDYRREYPIGKMCKVFKVSKSAFYRSLQYLPSERDHENRLLLFEIRRIHQQSKATYGSPRITDELKARGFNVSEPRVARLMKKHQIRAVYKKKFVVTTDSKHNLPVADNKLNRNFTTDAPGKAWVSDITYIKTAKGWLYMTAILDLYDRKVIGWAHSSDLSARNTSVAAWKMAVSNRPIAQNLIFHSDRGVQYACKEFTELLSTYPEVQQSMSRKGNCWDNAVAESFFKSLKVEHVHRHRFMDKKAAALSIFEWVETWYNRHRRHAALGNLTIQEFNQINKFKYAA